MSEGVVAQLQEIFEDVQTSPYSFSQTVKILEKKVLKVVGAWQQRLQDLWNERPKQRHEGIAGEFGRYGVTYYHIDEVNEFFEKLRKALGVGGAEPAIFPGILGFVDEKEEDS